MKHTAEKLCSVILVLVLAALCAALCAAPAAALSGDVDYSGLLDPYTGLPAETTEGKPNTNLISVADGVVYDQQNFVFVHYVDGWEISSNVTSGMVTAGSVYIVLPDGIVATLYRNGEALSDVNFSEISKPGSYVLDVAGSQVGSMQPLKFTIVSTVTGDLSEYRMPNGFRVNSLVFNGVETDCDPAVVPMTEEGIYEIRYTCFKTQISYSLNVTVDHTPPTLELKGVVNGGRSRGKVTLENVERDSSVQIYLNGNPIKYSNELTKNGTYRIIQQDKAGNSSVYDFYIPIYFNTNGVILVLLVIALIAAFAVYPVYARKHLRVR